MGATVMPKRKRTVGLIGFLKGNTDPAVGMPGCANYDHHHGGCLFADTCRVEQGQRCGYFEKAVLPTAADIGLRELVCSLYEKHTGLAGESILLRSVSVRECPDCGAALGYRQRLCAECSRRRRQKTKRENQRKYRNRNRLTVGQLT
jgi:hypothetical protein